MSRPFGECECGYGLQPVYYEEAETKRYDWGEVKTGRYRKACSHLFCDYCGRQYCVDDTFDGPWYNKK